jgi:hypothetical protein
MRFYISAKFSKQRVSKLHNTGSTFIILLTTVDVAVELWHAHPAFTGNKFWLTPPLQFILFSYMIFEVPNSSLQAGLTIYENISLHINKPFS